jgi:hypothetical protein
MSFLARALTAGLALSLILGGQTPLRAQGPGGGQARLRKQAPAPLFVARDALQRALNRGRLSEAEYALKRAESLFRLPKVRREFGDVERPDPHAATMLLRDLALRIGELSGKELKQARGILARPDDKQGEPFGQPYQSGPHEILCPGNYCLHWAVPGDPNAPPQVDADSNGRPDFVDDALATMDEVWQAEINVLGYRQPKSDATSQNNGPDGKIDVYLAEIGSDGIYGYCTSDDPANVGSPQYPYFDISAYCVLDNDYEEFPRTPPENLRVTAAHEFFHAIQFAYDAFEDFWLMEGTATAIEDIVYDDINDNLQFLFASQLTNPALPLDRSSFNRNHSSFNMQYGAWLWWRFMTEFLGTPGAPDNSVIKKVWNRADASPSAQFGDDYSLQAAKNVAKKNYSTGFKKLFSRWTAYLQRPETPSYFEEGSSYVSFLQAFGVEGRAPLTKSFTLGNGNVSSGWFKKRLDHLTSRHYRFLPGKGVKAGDKLKVVVDGPKRWRGTAATLLFVRGTNTLVKKVKFDRSGFGKRKIAFPDEAVLILANASTRTNCWTTHPNSPTSTSCFGAPKDDNLRFKAKGRLIKG